MKLKDLEGQAGVMQVLETLYQHGELNISDLVELVDSSRSSLIKAVDRLVNIKLVAETRMEKWPFRRDIRLTDTGKRFAAKLAEASEILEKY